MTQLSTIFDGLEVREIDYVQARANAKSDAEALRMIDASKGWLRNRDKDDLNQRALDFKTDNVLKAQIKLDEALPLAAEIKVEGLTSRDERIRQASASEIMDRRMGKAVQNIDQKVEQSGEVLVRVVGFDTDKL